MKKIAVAGLIFASSFYLTVGNAKDKIIEGIISEYRCGDNCYLTIIDAGGKKHSGLCTASLCQKWNENVEMPAKFKGQKARIIVGKGVQYDGGGDVIGEMDAFEKIDLDITETGKFDGTLKLGKEKSSISHVLHGSGEVVAYYFSINSDAGRKIIAVCQNNKKCDFTGTVRRLDKIPDGVDEANEIISVSKVKLVK